MARGMAGVFGGIMGSLIHTMIADAIPFSRRARASGIVSSAFSISTIAGVPLSLWLANHFGWRAPFMLIAALSVAFIAIGLRFLPELRQHLGEEKRAHLLSATFSVLGDMVGCIAGDKVPLTVHLLSPARRPVQVTRDLASFWSNGYRAVKAELKGRYPRHYWPDDPLIAEPTARVRPRPNPGR